MKSDIKSESCIVYSVSTRRASIFLLHQMAARCRKIKQECAFVAIRVRECSTRILILCFRVAYRAFLIFTM